MSMNWLKKYLTIKYFVVLALVDLDVLTGDLVNLQLVLEPGAEKKFASEVEQVSPRETRDPIHNKRDNDLDNSYQ